MNGEQAGKFHPALLSETTLCLLSSNCFTNTSPILLVPLTARIYRDFTP